MNEYELKKLGIISLISYAEDENNPRELRIYALELATKKSRDTQLFLANRRKNRYENTK